LYCVVSATKLFGHRDIPYSLWIAMPLPLNLTTLQNIPSTVQRPSYRREALRAGILHIGVGNFHRAHQGVYLDDLFNKGRDLDWAVLGAGVQPGDWAMRQALQPQDWLTTIVALEPGALRARVTGAMVDYLPIGPDGAGIIQALDDPAIRIVSLTITEGGYCIDPATGRFDASHPGIVYDAAHPDSPRGVFGTLVAALKRRQARGVEPFTIMSCDNLPGNGHVARDAVVGLADLVDPAVAAFVRSEVAFPNSMVDRITPVTGDRERARIAEEFDLQDRWPVACEPFRQWVLEDHFSAGRPALEEVGVTFTSEVTAYELMKLRILNGGHAAIAYPGALLGIHYVHDAVADPQIPGFLDRLELAEIIPCVRAPAGVDLQAYYKLVVQRFSNAEVGDTIPRLAFDGSNRQPKFILPSTRDRLALSADLTGLALVSALWCRYCAGSAENGELIEIADAKADVLMRAARAARVEPQAFLRLDDVFGDLGENTRFTAAFGAALSSLWTIGVRATLERYATGQRL
jgi:mannitol 2-dehydrogenase